MISILIIQRLDRPLIHTIIGPRPLLSVTYLLHLILVLRIYQMFLAIPLMVIAPPSPAKNEESQA